MVVRGARKSKKGRGDGADGRTDRRLRMRRRAMSSVAKRCWQNTKRKSDLTNGRSDARLTKGQGRDREALRESGWMVSLEWGGNTACLSAMAMRPLASMPCIYSDESTEYWVALQNISRKGRYLFDVRKIFRILDPSLVHIWSRSTVPNSRNLPFFVRFSTTPLPVRTSYKYHP